MLACIHTHTHNSHGRRSNTRGVVLSCIAQLSQPAFTTTDRRDSQGLIRKATAKVVVSLIDMGIIPLCSIYLRVLVSTSYESRIILMVFVVCLKTTQQGEEGGGGGDGRCRWRWEVEVEGGRRCYVKGNTTRTKIRGSVVS